MRYLVLTDIHANLEALEAVLRDAGEYDAVLCLGDLVGYGPDPNACVERIGSLTNLTCLVGNHELAALGEVDLAVFNPIARAAAVWTARTLSVSVHAFLSSLAPRLDRSDFVLAHGSPREPVWEYLETVAQAAASYGAFEGALCLVGHTHVPRVFTLSDAGHGVTVSGHLQGDRLRFEVGSRYIVNPGGVGQPRDGNPHAAYGVWDVDTGEFVFRRVAYDVPRTQAKILRASLPEVLATRLAQGA